MSKTILLVVIALASLLPVLPANAQSKAHWTAYAYDQTTGAWGLGWGLTDRQGTMDMALSKCSKPDCKVGYIGDARCIAASLNEASRKMGFGTGQSIADAEASAQKWCLGNTPRAPCHSVGARCSY